jgi:hypothetical protein
MMCNRWIVAFVGGVCASANWGSARAESLPQPSAAEGTAPAETPVPAETPDDLGFSETSAAPAAPPSENERRSPWSLSGFARSDALWTSTSQQYRPGELKSSIDVRLGYDAPLSIDATSGSLELVAAGHAEYDAAYSVAGVRADAPTREVYEWQALPKEVYLAVRLGPVELALGRQIVNWGQGEVLSVLDVLNPRDLRVPGQADVADLRLAVMMARLGLSFGPQRFAAAVITEPYFGMLPPPLGRLSPLRDLLLGNPQLENALSFKELRFAHDPEHELVRMDAAQYHARWTYSGPGFDLALQYASLLDGLGTVSLPSPQAFATEQLDLRVYHARYHMVGHSGAVPIGPLLLRWELAVQVQRPITLRRIDTPLLETFAERRTQLDALVGLTYFIRGNTTAAIELAQSYLVDNPARESMTDRRPLWPVELPQVALRFDYEFLDERARAGLVVVSYGIAAPVALAARLEVSYAVLDEVRLGLGGIAYHSTSRFSPLYGFDDNDRVYVRVQWDFGLM